MMQSETMGSGNEPAELGDVLAELLGRDAAARIDESRRAAAAWALANGDAERAHARKAYLSAARRPGVAPVLVVEVDSHALLSDFNAKRELYLGRLAHYGLAVSAVRFRYVAPRAGRDAPPGSQREPAPRQPGAAEQARADELSALVGERLRPAVARAVAASLAADNA